MDLGSECSLHESVEDNDSITNISASEMFGDHDRSKNDGYCAVEDERFYVNKGKGSEILGSGNLPSSEIEHEVSPSPSMTKKGFGLKKWKRIQRDADKSGDHSVDAGKMVKQDLLSPDANTSKRLQVSVGKQKSEGSVSSTDAVLRSLDGFALLGDSGLAIKPSFAAGTDSENSEDRSSKSSTAASAQKSRYETPGVMGFPRDKRSLRSSSGKNLTRSVQRGLQVKNQVETGNKARGERVKIEKENSHCSMESDSRSSFFVFIRGTYPTSNGKQSARLSASDGENGDEVYGRERLFNNELPGGSKGDYERRHDGKSQDDIVADSYGGFKEDESENHASSRDRDSLVESIFALQSVQEALEKEVLKFREIIHDVSNDDSVGNLLLEFEDISQELPQATSERSQHDEGELEYFFKQKIEAEIEYLVLSRMGQQLRVDVVDQNLILRDHIAVAHEQTQTLDKLQDAENKAKMIKKEAVKLENPDKDIANAKDILTLQYGIFNYTLCFFMQLVLLVVIIGVYMFRLLPLCGYCSHLDSRRKSPFYILNERIFFLLSYFVKLESCTFCWSF